MLPQFFNLPNCKISFANHCTEPENTVDEMLAPVKWMGIFLLTAEEPKLRTVISLFFFCSSVLQGFEGFRLLDHTTKHSIQASLIKMLHIKISCARHSDSMTYKPVLGATGTHMDVTKSE